MATDAGLRRLRGKYKGALPPERPVLIDEQSWAIFTNYVFERRSLRSMRNGGRTPLNRLRKILYEVDAQLELQQRISGVTPQSSIEELALSIRARNALHRLGLRTVNDVLQLDMSGPVPRVGAKTRMEVLMALQSAGFRHPALNRGPMVGVTSFSRSLERMQERINMALRLVAKEVGAVQRQLQEWLKE